jgi:hypothetical protein
MKMTRNLIILGVLVVLAVGLVFAAPLLKPAATPSPSATPNDSAERQLSNYSTDQVVEVTVENPNGAPYTLVMKDKNYVVKGNESIALDQTQASSLFSSAGYILGERLLEANATDVSAYGLDKPKAKVTATYADGKSSVFLLGDMAPTGNTYYLMKQGDPRVVSVWMNIGAAFSAKVDALMQKQTVDLAKEDIDHVKIIKNGATTLEIANQTEEKVSISSWKILQPWVRYIDTNQLDAFLTSVAAAKIGDIVEGNATDLGQYGLDKPLYDISASGKGKSYELLIGKDKTESQAYAKYTNSNMVYLIDKSTLEFAKTTPFKLMDKMIVLVNINSALGIEVKGLGADTKLVIDQIPTLDDKGVQKLDGNGNPMVDQKFSVNGTAVDDKVARFYYQECIGLQTFATLEEGWKPSGSPVLSLTYTRDKDPKVITLEFYDYSTDFYAVKINDLTLFTIKKEKIQKIADETKLLADGKLTVPAS